MHLEDRVRPVRGSEHITAQQLLALCLQEGQLGERTWQEWLPVPALTADAPQIAAYLLEQGFLDSDGGMLFIGPEAERRFGHRHFMSLMAVFTAPPEFTRRCRGTWRWRPWRRGWRTSITPRLCSWSRHGLSGSRSGTALNPDGRPRRGNRVPAHRRSKYLRSVLRGRAIAM